MDAVKDLTLPSFSFLIGAAMIVFAVVRNISIKQIDVKLGAFQSFLLGILGIVFIGIGIYGYFLYPEVKLTDLAGTQDPMGGITAENESFSSISSDAFRNSLFDGQSLVSPNGQHVLHFQDGVATLFSNSKVVWQTKTEGSKADQLIIQADGNLVLYANNVYIWDTQSAVASPAQSYTFEIQNDGNLVIYDNNGVRNWSLK